MTCITMIKRNNEIGILVDSTGTIVVDLRPAQEVALSLQNDYFSPIFASPEAKEIAAFVWLQLRPRVLDIADVEAFKHLYEMGAFRFAPRIVNATSPIMNVVYAVCNGELATTIYDRAVAVEFTANVEPLVVTVVPQGVTNIV